MSRRSMHNSKMDVKRLNLNGQDASGGIVQVKTTVFTVPCRIRQLNASEQPVGGKNGVVSTHRISCSQIDIRPKDECIINKMVYDVNTLNTGSHNKSLWVDVTIRS